MTSLSCNLQKNDESYGQRQTMLKICESTGCCPICKQNIKDILDHVESQHSRDEPSRVEMLNQIKEALISMKMAISKIFLLKNAYTHHKATDQYKEDNLNTMNSLLGDLEETLKITKNYK